MHGNHDIDRLRTRRFSRRPLSDRSGRQVAPAWPHNTTGALRVRPATLRGDADTVTTEPQSPSPRLGGRSPTVFAASWLSSGEPQPASRFPPDGCRGLAEQAFVRGQLGPVRSPTKLRLVCERVRKGQSFEKPGLGMAATRRPTRRAIVAPDLGGRLLVESS
jgi:hypothetical protein